MFPVVELAAELTHKVLQLHVNPLPVSFEVTFTLREVPDKLGGAGCALTVVVTRVGFICGGGNSMITQLRQY